LDLHDLWQEHKRWILGVAAGLVLFWIGSSVIGALFDAAGAEAKVRALARSAAAQPLYDADAKKRAETDRDALKAAELRLRAAEEFHPSDEFLLAGKGEMNIHFNDVSQRVRRQVSDRAQEYGVELQADDVAWTPPIGRAEIESTLIGLCVLEQAALRLLEAGEAVRAQDPDALGLVSIESMRVDKLTGAKKPGRRARRGMEKDDDRVDVTERIDEYPISFKFRSDIATVQLFLERCRSVDPPLSLRSDFKIQSGREPGDPLTITGKLSAITIRDL